MNWIQIVMTILQVITIIVVGIIGYFLKDKFTSLKEADIKNECRISKMEESFSEFKEKMPLMYTTREDQLRAQAALENRIEKLGTSMESNFKEINTKIENKLDTFTKGFENKYAQLGEQLNKHLQREV